MKNVSVAEGNARSPIALGSAKFWRMGILTVRWVIEVLLCDGCVEGEQGDPTDKLSEHSPFLAVLANCTCSV